MDQIISRTKTPNIRRILMLETKSELLKLLRNPQYSFFTLAFPALLYLLFASIYAGQTAEGGVAAGKALLVSYAVFGVMTASLFSFGAGLAVERAQGWLRLKQVSPMPLWVLLVAKILVALLFALAITVILTVLGLIVAGVHLGVERWLRLLAGLLVGVLPFASIGLWVGIRADSNAASGLINMINLTLAFASGLFIPLEFLPQVVQHLAPYLPSYMLNELVLAQTTPQVSGVARSLIGLLIYTALFFWLAWRAMRREGALG